LEVEMTAEEFELLSAAEAEAILAERYTRLTEAGYPPTSALVAATHIEVDIEVAEQLVHDAQPASPPARSSDETAQGSGRSRSQLLGVV
jgi:hypothetical protein